MKYMKNIIFKKNYIVLFLITIFAFIYFAFNKNSTPFEPIQKRYTMVEDHQLISIKETKDGVMVYSIGKVNSNIDNIYFVDMVKKSIISYKWLGGGGHINRGYRENENFIFSAQLLNEEQNINPTLFGILLDENINKIDVRISKGFFDSIIYDGENRNEKLYVVSFENNVSNETYFIFTVWYKNGKSLEFSITGEEINKFQRGGMLYFYEENIQ